MSRKIFVFAIILTVFVAALIFLYLKFSSNQKSGSVNSYTTLIEYGSSIDFSCGSDSDCEIKDVHNCCGYYPMCVNINAKVDPDFVNKACRDEGIGSACGFRSIDSCRCVDGKCNGYLLMEQ